MVLDSTLKLDGILIENEIIAEQRVGCGGEGVGLGGLSLWRRSGVGKVVISLCRRK